MKKSKPGDYFKLLVESTQVGIVEVDEKEKIVFSNDGYAKMLGYKKQELEGKNLRKLTNDDEYSKFLKGTKRRKEGKRDIYNAKLKRKDGRMIDIEVAVSPLWREDGSYKGSLAVVMDVSEQKKMERRMERYSEQLEQTVKERTEKLSQLVESQKEFIAHVSHELRTPLSIIKAVAESEIDRSRDKKLIQMELVDRKVDQVKRILKNLTLISRLDVSGSEVRRENIRLKELLEEAGRDVLREARVKEMDLKLKLSCQERLKIKGDRVKIVEVVSNLMRNAVLHSNGKPKVMVKVEKINEKVRIMIKDNNRWIAKKDLKLIFKKFYRGKRARSQPGLGLGLYICEVLVKIMGGRIWVERELVGRGNKFIVELPIA